MQEAKRSRGTERFFVVLNSDSLHAPAIFLSFEDCSFYIDQEENELPVEYKSFSTLDEASSFLKLSLGNNNDVDGGKVKESTSAQAGSSTSKIPVQHSSVSRKRRRLSTELENAEFNEMIKQLGECKDNGTAIKHNARLQGWIAKQRKEYQSYKCNAETTMTPKRIAELARHGFNFESKKKMTWDERAVQWLEYRSQTGNDPKRYSSDGLGKWVLDQRKKYKMLKNGEHTNLTEDQVSKLTEWGFTWDNKIKVPEVIVERRPWDHRFQDLIAFKESHGHTNVPQGTPGLWHWVRSQRSEYVKFLKGQKCGMTKAKLQKLKSIGFAFQSTKAAAKEAHFLIPDALQKEPDFCKNSDPSETDRW